MLVTELLKKIQFRHNQTQLQELDDQSLDDDVGQSFHFFVSSNLSLVAMGRLLI